ncbi:exonuclease SbcCD subunit D [Lachnoclostridium sp. Marseille-P6806]|uniref:exonuclease SbcCD subunit D n=1 Tax=Lachnoclostridium sp. Marseille-P6806 TaxID=2364793 RepID=UPI0010326760|nr:exonuclease SbcCD subunit D [Lachnoclostridium sp. Marseille-P6806]
MRFFHLSDLHIGLKLLNRDLYEDQAYILRQIVQRVREERPDAVVIAGDIYDKAVPSAEAVELFDRFIGELAEASPETAIMAISGNHDSAPRLDCYRGILARQHLYMIGRPPQREDEYIERVTLRDDWGPVHFYLLPFVKPSMVKAITGTDENGNNLSYDRSVRRLLGRERVDVGERNVLVSHQFYLPAGTDAGQVERMSSEIRTIGNIDQIGADVLSPFDYAALGHIHKPMTVGDERFRYCGTPLACSVDEAGQSKAIVAVELGEKGAVPRISFIPLTPLRAVRVLRGGLEEVLRQSCDDYVSVRLTDRVDHDIFDMKERLRLAFPYLLEIRRENLRSAEYTAELSEEQETDPYALCLAFLGETSEEERELLREVFASAEKAERS